jgi:PAS domain S-box-containing protein
MKQVRGNETISTVIRIVALYALFSALWIYLSDTALEIFIQDPHQITRYAIFKGFAFILVTSTLLAILIARHISRMAETNQLFCESEERLRFTAYSVENITDAVYWITRDGRFWDCNRAACAMLGYSREELLSLSVFDIDPEFASEDAAAHLAELMEKGSKKFTRFHTAKDGHTIPVEITTSYFVFNEQEYFCSIVRDIGDRVQAEKEATFFRSLIECTREPVYVADLEDGGRMFYANPAACAHYGLELEKLRTMRIPDWDPVFNMEVRADMWEQQKKGKLLRFETKHRLASGELIPVEVTSNYLLFDGKEYSAGSFHDIRERKAMEAALRESERNLIEAQRIARVGNWSRDLAGNLLYASAECRRIYGKGADQIVGTFESFMELVHPNDRQRIREAFAGIVQTGEPFQTDFGIIRPDGMRAVIRARGELVRDEPGNPARVIGTVQDITEQQRAEADRIELERQLLNIQKLESLGVLAGGIAHDFNNLLTGIMGNLSLMRMDLPPGHPLNERIERCEKGVRQATGLTCQLLTFSRGGDPVKKLIDPCRAIRDAVSFSLHGSNVAHEMELGDDLWPIEADEGQIGQVLQNLLINADQSMPRGGIVRVEACNRCLTPGQVPGLDPGAYVLISVIDHGTGIAPEHLDRIFDPYFTTKETGSGLGLAALYSIVKKHDGQVQVTSQPGSGSEFRVYLPANPEQGLPGDGTGNDAPPRPAGGEEFILVMDDEEMVRVMASEMLSVLGYGVETCSCGEELIQIYGNALGRGEKPYAVIMDLTIPGRMGGVEASTALRALDPAAVLIVSSGYSNDPVLSNFRKYGFTDSLTKPFRVEDLVAVLSRIRESSI